MKNEFTMTYAVLRSWLMHMLFRGRGLVRTVFSLVFGVLSIWGCALSITTGNTGYIVLYAFLAFLFLYRSAPAPFISLNRQYKQLCKMYGKTEWRRVILFEDASIVVTEETSKWEYKYSDITRISERGDLVELYFISRVCVRFYISSFTDGDWESCKKLIEQKRTA